MYLYVYYYGKWQNNDEKKLGNLQCKQIYFVKL